MVGLCDDEQFVLLHQQKAAEKATTRCPKKGPAKVAIVEEAEMGSLPIFRTSMIGNAAAQK